MSNQTLAILTAPELIAINQVSGHGSSGSGSGGWPASLRAIGIPATGCC